MAHTKKMIVSLLTTTCPCRIESARHIDKDMIIPGTPTHTTPGKSIMNTIKLGGAMNATTAERVANTKTISTIIGIVLEIIEIPDIVVETIRETIGRITGSPGMIDITLPVGRTPLTTCTDHILNTDISR